MFDFNDQTIKLTYPGDKKHLDNLVDEIFKMEVYKPAVEGLDKEKSIVINVGGYIGDSAIYFTNYAKKVYTLEPSNVYDILLHNIKDNNLEDKIIPFNLAMANTNGKRLLYIVGNDNIGATMIPFTANKASFEVQSITLKKFLEDNKIDHVDLMEMDIEGMEYEVLEGEGFQSVADKIDRIIMEVHPFTIPGAASGVVWKIPYLLNKMGFETRLAHSSDSWRVLLNYANGSKKWVSMPIFIAERKR